MKLKKWLSRALVLAMVVALMIPVPVAAKGGGGKLVKSVTVYDYKTSGRWEADYQTAYKYDKKNNPVELTTTNYYGHFLGVPTRGSKSVSTVKYKYKGKSPKSAKVKDGAGKVTSTRKYSKGRVVGITSANATSEETTQYDSATDTYVFKGDNITSTATNKTASYDKYGLATSYSYAYSQNEQSASGATSADSDNETHFYTITQKKGVPSMIIDSEASGYAWSNASGSSSYQENADGTWTSTYNGVVESGKDTVLTQGYATFNAKGLVVEEGTITTDTTTGKQKVRPSKRYEYAMKKGKVTQAVKFSLTTNADGVVTKATPTQMYKFKYAKAKASKVRYLSMINYFVDCGTGFFAWF